MANTLEKMQAEGLYEDEGLTTQESEQSLETETLEESEAVVAEESNEAEVVLVGDEQALPNQSERENHAWGSLRRNNRSLKRENREKDEEVLEIWNEVLNNLPGVPTLIVVNKQEIPNFYDNEVLMTYYFYL